MKIIYRVYNDEPVPFGPLASWEIDPDGTHVPLPLDASALSDAVVEKVAQAIRDRIEHDTPLDQLSTADREMWCEDARAAITALAAALAGEVE